MEAAGLAIAVLPLACRGYQKCTKLFYNTRNLHEDICESARLLATEQEVFHRECRYLLRMVISKTVAKDMMGDFDHIMWKCPSFTTEWKKHIGKECYTRIEHVKDSLDSIEKLLSPLIDRQDKPEVQPQVFFLLVYIFALTDMYNDSKQQSASIQPRGKQRSVRVIPVLKWITTQKAKVHQFLSELQAENVALKHSRKSRALLSKLEKRQHPKTRIKLEEQESHEQERPYENKRDSSKTLYDKLSTTNMCSCHTHAHQVNFQLDSSMSQQSDIESTSVFDAKFCLLFTKIPDLNNKCRVECNQLTVQSELQYPGRKRSGKHGKPEEYRVKRKKPPQKHTIVTTTTTTTTTTTSPTCRLYPENAIPFENSLCSFLAQANHNPQDLSVFTQTPERGTFSSKYRHVIYSGHYSVPAVLTTLEDLLSSHSGRQVLSMTERLRIALAISLSLLQDGSHEVSWFRNRWRSKDILFYLPENKAMLAFDSCLNPYMRPTFPPPNNDNANTQRPNVSPNPTAMSQSLARNEHLYSLAIVLLEIAMEEKLTNIDYLPDLKEVPTDVGYAEYIKCKAIVQSTMIKERMGTIYARLVTRCLFCDFGQRNPEVDFTQNELQDLYYDNVVRELARILAFFRTG